MTAAEALGPDGEVVGGSDVDGSEEAMPGMDASVEATDPLGGAEDAPQALTITPAAIATQRLLPTDRRVAMPGV